MHPKEAVTIGTVVALAKAKPRDDVATGRLPFIDAVYCTNPFARARMGQLEATHDGSHPDHAATG
mgnify:CR=1